ncbi:MAG: ABC transporter substrate-binding protein [Methylocella sp.]
MIGGAAMVAVGFATATTPASAQSGEPIKIGFSMALTGPLAPNGKQALLGARIWEQETNAKGGLLGRPVKLVYYDDQSKPAAVPEIYTKLLDVDKVDLVVGPYATNMNAPAMPVVMQKGKTFISLFALGLNSEFNYPKYFSMLPTGSDTKPSFTEGFFGFVTQFGGVNSHMAIRASELAVPAVIGAGETLFGYWNRARKICLDCGNQQVQVIS